MGSQNIHEEFLKPLVLRKSGTSYEIREFKKIICKYLFVCDMIKKYFQILISIIRSKIVNS